jgi:DNA helicase-2/ATP-dependent DNA helicase PcrA
MANKPILVIAGPGAGKTYGMVNEIIQSLKHLSSAKYLIVITYTNSATNNIKERLAKRIQIPQIYSLALCILFLIDLL